jgi:hypothetical protein
MLPAGKIQDPDRPFPFASQAVENSTLQFLLTENLSTGIISHLIKISLWRLKDLAGCGKTLLGVIASEAKQSDS